MINGLRLSGLLCVLLLLIVTTVCQGTESAASDAVWNYDVYVDLGYAGDFNDPGNHTWRSKGTGFEVNHPRINMATAWVGREATSRSRWGVEIGLQGGVDTKPLALSEDSDRLKYAEELKHLSAASASYLFGAGNGLIVEAGLFGAYIGYESFHAAGNPNYTRGYLTDNIPYFLIGLQATYPLMDNLELSLHAVTGYNYLEDLNKALSYGLQVAWSINSGLSYTQNFYYGPDQEETNLDYWRLFSDSIVEWTRGPYLLAVEIYGGTEKQAVITDHPRYNWMAGAVWVRWNPAERWSLAFRPEFYSDPDGLISGARQFIQAYTTTVKHVFVSTGTHKVEASLEYRYDRSTGDEGGYYKGPDNRLVPEANLLLFALTWFYNR